MGLLKFVRLYSDKAARFVPTSGVYPKGYSVGGIHCGIKKNGNLDLALLKNEYGKGAVASAVFTTNKFKAAPVQLSSKIVKEKEGKNINSIIINSGNANAVTGTKGLNDAQSMVSATDKCLGNEENSTLVMSTGVIGNLLPIEKILTGIEEITKDENLGNSHEDWLKCANAICTTDTFPKLVTKNFEIDGITYTLAGLAKGAGMISPNMATLLGFFVTDAPVSNTALKLILQYAVDRSFNCITVDGDMSTNDTIVAIANGAAGGELIDQTSSSSTSYSILRAEITDFAQQLSQLVVRDGEGATKFIHLKVKDALSFKDAKSIASSIANSALFKTAMYGSDANWGRILCAVGYADVATADSVLPEKTSVSFIPSDGSEPLPLLVNGEPETVDEERASQILSVEDLCIEIDLGTGGNQEASFWTCDLSHDYVTINGDYRS